MGSEIDTRFDMFDKDLESKALLSMNEPFEPTSCTGRGLKPSPI